MKRYFMAAMISIAIGAFASFQVGCSNSPTANSNTIAVATPEPTPDKAAVTAELTKIENDWPRIIKERDGAAVRRVEADDIVIIYPDGGTGNKEQDAKDIESGSLTADSWILLRDVMASGSSWLHLR